MTTVATTATAVAMAAETTMAETTTETTTQAPLPPEAEALRTAMQAAMPYEMVVFEYADYEGSLSGQCDDTPGNMGKQ